MNIERCGTHCYVTPRRLGSRLHRVPLRCPSSASTQATSAGAGATGTDHPVIQVLRTAASSSQTTDSTKIPQPLAPIERLPANSWTTAASQQQALTVKRLLNTNPQPQQQNSSQTQQQELQQQLQIQQQQQQQQPSTATTPSRSSQTSVLSSTQATASASSTSAASQAFKSPALSTDPTTPLTTFSTSTATFPSPPSTHVSSQSPDNDGSPAATAWVRTPAAAQEATATTESQQGSSSSITQPMLAVAPSTPELPWQLPPSPASDMMSKFTIPVLALSLLAFGLKWFLGGGAAPKEQPKVWPAAPVRTPLLTSTAGVNAALSRDSYPPINYLSTGVPAPAAAGAVAVAAGTASPAMEPTVNRIPEDLRRAELSRNIGSSSSRRSSSSRSSVKLQPGWWRELATLHYIDFGQEFGVLPWVRGDPVGLSDGETASLSALAFVAFQDASDAQFVSDQVVQFMLAAILPGEVDSEQLIRSLRPRVKSLTPLSLESIVTRQGQRLGNLGVVPSNRLDLSQIMSESQLQEVLSELVSFPGSRPAVKAATATPDESSSASTSASTSATAVQSPTPAPSITNINSDPWAQPRIDPSKTSLNGVQAVSSKPAAAADKAPVTNVATPPAGMADGEWSMGLADFPGFDDPPSAATAAAAAKTAITDSGSTSTSTETTATASVSAAVKASEHLVSSLEESMRADEQASIKDTTRVNAPSSVEAARLLDPVITPPPALRFSFSKKSTKTFATLTQAATSLRTDSVISSVSNPNLIRPQASQAQQPIKPVITQHDAAVPQAATETPAAAPVATVAATSEASSEATAVATASTVQAHAVTSAELHRPEEIEADLSRTIIDSQRIEVQIPEDEDLLDFDTEQAHGRDFSNVNSNSLVVAAEYEDVPAELSSSLPNLSQSTHRAAEIDQAADDILITTDVQEGSFEEDAMEESELGEEEQEIPDPDLELDMLRQFYDLEEQDLNGGGTIPAERGSVFERNMEATGRSYAQDTQSQTIGQTASQAAAARSEFEERFRKKAVDAVASLLGSSPDTEESEPVNTSSQSSSTSRLQPATSSHTSTQPPLTSSPTISQTFSSVNTDSDSPEVPLLASVPDLSPPVRSATPPADDASNDSIPSPLPEHALINSTESSNTSESQQQQPQPGVSLTETLQQEMTASQRQLALVMGRMAVARVQGKPPPATARQELQQLQSQLSALKTKFAAAQRDESEAALSSSHSDPVDDESSFANQRKESEAAETPSPESSPLDSMGEFSMESLPDTSADVESVDEVRESLLEQPVGSSSSSSVHHTSTGKSTGGGSSSNQSSNSSSSRQDSSSSASFVAAVSQFTPQHTDPTPSPLTSALTTEAADNSSTSSNSSTKTPAASPSSLEANTAAADNDSSSSSTKKLAAKASSLGAKSGWGSWSKNPRIFKAGVSLLRNPLTEANSRLTPSSLLSPSPSPEQHSSVVDAAAGGAAAEEEAKSVPAIPGISSHPLADIDTEAAVLERDEDGVVVYSRGVGKVRPKKVERAPEERQASVKEALRFIASSNSSSTAVNPLDDDEAEYGRPTSSRSNSNSNFRSGSDGRVRMTPSARSASLMEGVEGGGAVEAPQKWWQKQFQMLWMPNVTYEDGTNGFVQINVSLDESVRDVRVLCFEDRHDCQHCMAMLRQWPQFDWCKFSIASMSTSKLEETLRSMHEEQAELNEGVGKPAGVVVFRRGKLEMRLNMGFEEFTQRVIWQAAAQLSLSSVGYQFDD